MKPGYLAICSALAMLVATWSTAQDTVCENFEVEEIACNDPPYNSCSSRTILKNVIIGDNGFGYKHPATEPLSCPGGPHAPEPHTNWLRWTILTAPSFTVVASRV
jgi:hypothetical protein